MTIRAYIAAAKSQQARAERRAKWHRDRGHVVASTWHAHPVADVDPAGRADRSNIAMTCMSQIDSADLFELLSGGDPRGALWEYGFATGRGLTTAVERGCPTLFDSQAIRELDPSWDVADWDLDL